MKKVVIGSDGSGVNLKEAVKAYLIENNYEVFDVGQQIGGAAVTHVTAARNIADTMRKTECEKGIIFCGTGAGASMCMNKQKGMYCVACESLFSAPKIALINNANVLAMGARIVGPENACEMAEAFLSTGFAQDFAPQRKQTVENLYNEMLKLEAEVM